MSSGRNKRLRDDEPPCREQRRSKRQLQILPCGQNDNGGPFVMLSEVEASGQLDHRKRCTRPAIDVIFVGLPRKSNPAAVAILIQAGMILDG